MKPQQVRTKPKRESIRVLDSELKVARSDVMDVLKEAEPAFEPKFDNIVVIAGLPRAKGEKKINTLKKAIYYQIIKPLKAKLSSTSSLVVPDNGKGTALGFALIEFKTAKEARLCISNFHNSTAIFGSQYPIRVLPCPIVSDLLSLEAEPALIPQPREVEGRHDRLGWLADPLARPMLFARSSRVESHLLWFDALPSFDEFCMVPADPKRRRYFWTPQGTYLVAQTDKGLTFLAGDEMRPALSIPHEGVDMWLFSECERFALTIASGAADGSAQILWALNGAQPIHHFSMPNLSERGLFHFSASGRHFIRLRKGTALEVRHIQGGSAAAPAYTLSPAAPIRLVDIAQFEMAPTEDWAAVFQTATESRPARITVLEMPRSPKAQHSVIATHNAFKVEQLQLSWHPQSDYLAMCIGATGKGSEGSVYEILDLRSEATPTETVDFPNFKGSRTMWEPHGRRFVVFLDGGERVPGSQTVHVVTLPEKVGRGSTEKTVIRSLPASVQALAILWSPCGRYFLCACPTPGGMILVDAETLDIVTLPDSNNLIAHWEPNGRFFLTFPDPEKSHTSKPTLNVWSFYGRHIGEYHLENLTQAMWRPIPRFARPTSDEEAAVDAALEKHRDEFERVDGERRSEYLATQMDEITRVRRMWLDWEARSLSAMEAEAAEFARILRDGLASRGLDPDLSYRNADGSRIVPDEHNTLPALFVRRRGYEDVILEETSRQLNIDQLSALSARE
eukprot:gnl/Chilomastix_cuspidata/408.p1 GENE.gnl/Chilomastix_cuspidata/408~~gnl/Chilomastix_cuspidata/408.p1  ORF type:complete len:735 (+),score=374.08 gnl/Chilomastix_cuspidata/408:943-3147(+)